MQRTTAPIAARARPSATDTDTVLDGSGTPDSKRTRQNTATDSWVEVPENPVTDSFVALTEEEIDAATSVLLDTCGPSAAGAAAEGLRQAGSRPSSPSSSGLLDLNDIPRDVSRTTTDTSADVDAPRSEAVPSLRNTSLGSGLDRMEPVSDPAGASSDMATDGVVEELSPADALAAAPGENVAGASSDTATDGVVEELSPANALAAPPGENVAAATMQAAGAAGLNPAEAQALAAAVQVMQNDPELRRVVRSLAMDPNIHEAVRQNPAVADFARRQAAAGLALEGGAFAGPGGGGGVGGGGAARQHIPGPIRNILFGREHKGPMGFILKHVQALFGHLAIALDELFFHLNTHANGIAEKVTGHPLDAAENEHVRTALVLAVTVVSVAIIRRPLLRPFAAAAAAF